MACAASARRGRFMIVTGFEKAYRIYDLQIDIGEGSHTVCRFTAVVEKKDADQYLDYARSRKASEVMHEQKDGKKIVLMTGVVRNVRVHYGSTRHTLDVELVSPTVEMSESTHFRIFQSTQKTVKGMIDWIMQAYSHPVTFQGANRFDEIVEHPVVQSNQTDFDFLLGLAGHVGAGVWVEDTGIVIGEASKEIRIEQDSRKEIIYQRALEEGCEIIEFETQYPIKNGTKIQYGGRTFEIRKIKVYEHMAYIYYRYTAFESREHICPMGVVPLLLGSARVAEVEDEEKLGRVRVEFLDLEDVQKGDKNRIWIDYISPYVGRNHDGIVFMPDVGDLVEVHSNASRLVAIGSLRQKQIREACQEIHNKYISVHDKIRIAMEEEKLVCSYGEDTSLSVDDQKVYCRKGDMQISVEGSRLTVTLDGSDTQIDVKDGSILLTGTKSRLHVTGDKVIGDVSGNNVTISDSIQMKKGSNAIEITGNQIKLSAGKIKMDT